MKKVLFICTGNVCRSPMAAAMFNAMAEEEGLSVRAESAGVAALEDEAIAPHAATVMQDMGVDTRAHRARQVAEEMIQDADLVLVMSPQHLAALRRTFEGLPGKVYTLIEYATNISSTEGIPDPYGHGISSYRSAARQIFGYLELAMKRLQREMTLVEQSNYKHAVEVKMIHSQIGIDAEVQAALDGELERQRTTIELIASENFASPAVLAAQGSVLTNKYAEGYPGRRYYGGCEWVDKVEQLAIDRARELFGAEHINVQPHSGSQANEAAYAALIDPGDKVLSMDLAHGGHLTHGMKINFSGRTYDFVHYGVGPDGYIDYDQVQEIALRERPRMILAGASAYPRVIHFDRFREIADSVGAYLIVDMAHIAGLVAAGVHPSPIPYCEIVTTTTHKTLRGARGGMILCREEFAKKVNSRVFPGIQGGPLMHAIAGKAVALGEALRPEFKDYALQIVSNAKAMAKGLVGSGFNLVSGGTDNHLMLLDLRGTGITGKELEERLEAVGVTANKNMIPHDPEPPTVTSGVRLGTAAVTTRGMVEKDMREIAGIISRAARGEADGLKDRVAALTEAYPLYA